MAILDFSLQLAKAQANVRAAGTYVSQNVIDLGVAGGIKIIGDRGYLQVRVGTAFATGDSVEFQLVAADNAALSSNPVVLMSTGAIARANLTANTIVWETQLPQVIPKRYLGLKAVAVAASAFTAGDFDANIVVDRTITY